MRTAQIQHRLSDAQFDVFVDTLQIVVMLQCFLCADWLRRVKLLALFYFPVEQLPRSHPSLTGIKVNVVWN